MKDLNGQYYVAVKDNRYKIHPTENNISRLRDEKSLRTRYQFQNDTQMRKNQKVIKIGNIQLAVKNYPKIKQPIFQQQKLKQPKCPSCRQRIG